MAGKSEAIGMYRTSMPLEIVIDAEQYNLGRWSFSGAPDEVGKTFNLPKVFIKHDAAAVIATICPIPDRFAAAFARVFYGYFLDQQMTIGEALRATRWYFLKEHHNPLGLAYGLYSPAHYRLAKSPAEGGMQP